MSKTIKKNSLEFFEDHFSKKRRYESQNKREERKKQKINLYLRDGGKFDNN